MHTTHAALDAQIIMPRFCHDARLSFIIIIINNHIQINNKNIYSKTIKKNK